MLSLVEKFICATFFSYTLFRVLTSPLSNLLKTVFTKSHAERLAATSFAPLLQPSHTPTSYLYHALEVTLVSFRFFSKIIWVSKTHKG